MKVSFILLWLSDSFFLSMYRKCGFGRGKQRGFYFTLRPYRGASSESGACYEDVRCCWISLESERIKHTPGNVKSFTLWHLVDSVVRSYFFFLVLSRLIGILEHGSLVAKVSPWTGINLFGLFSLRQSPWCGLTRRSWYLWAGSPPRRRPSWECEDPRRETVTEIDYTTSVL